MATVVPHIQWLVHERDVINETDHTIKVYSFSHQQDNAILSAWAKHFRNHYCLDSKIDRLRQGTGLSREQYLLQLKFPDPTNNPGPSIISGDFAEILVADYMEYVLNYWVPRERYLNKTVRNESPKATDVVGFKISSIGSPSVADELLIFEVKAKLSVTGAESRLQDAIDDSLKDSIRIAEGLNALKQQFLIRNEESNADKVERFQNKLDLPFTEIFGAAAVLDRRIFDLARIRATKSSLSDPLLLVIHGEEMMNLARELYRRAANEA